MKTSAVFVALLGLSVCLLTPIEAQPTCRVFKTFNAAANTGLVQDTIVVPDSFPVSSIQVTNMVLGHPQVSSLTMSLVHKVGDTAQAPVVLAASPSMVGAYAPTTPVNGDASGSWVLRVEDTQPGFEQRLISLTSWTLQLCSGAAVTATDGKADASAVVVVEDKGSDSSKDHDGDHHDDGSDDKDGKLHGVLNFLFPGLKNEDVAPDGILGHIHDVNDHVRDSANEHVYDFLKLVADSSDLYKSYWHKKIDDAISDVNKVGSVVVEVVKSDIDKFSLHDKSLHGFIVNLKDFVVSEAYANVESALKMVTDLTNLHGVLSGHFKSSIGAVGDLVAASLSNLGSLYLTVEGVAKTHINNFITAKSHVLETLLDKIIEALKHMEDSHWTGPVTDITLKLDVHALEKLSEALDHVEKVVLDLPVPSQVATKSFGVFTSLIKSTHVYDLLTETDFGDHPLTSGLIGKIGTARVLLKKFAPILAASQGPKP